MERAIDWDALGAWGTVTAAGIAVITYRDSVIRACKLETIKEFSRIRMKYPNMSRKAKEPGSEEIVTAYLRELERFCTGVLEGVYDIDIVATIAGSLLVSQYDDFMKKLIEKRRGTMDGKPNAGRIYEEYIIVIQKVRQKKQKKMGG